MSLKVKPGLQRISLLGKLSNFEYGLYFAILGFKVLNRIQISNVKEVQFSSETCRSCLKLSKIVQPCVCAVIFS